MAALGGPKVSATQMLGASRTSRMKRSLGTEDCERVHAALLRVGGCSKVPFTVESIEIDEGLDPSLVTIGLTLHYQKASPVCCPVPGCYIPFLGNQSGWVPKAVQDALSLLDEPRVRARVRSTHEPGYAYLEIGSATDQVTVVEPEEFRVKFARSHGD